MLQQADSFYIYIVLFLIIYLVPTFVFLYLKKTY